MIEFFSLSKEAFGLEITDTTVRLMQLARKNGKLSVATANWLKLEEGIVKDGNILNEDRLAASIREAAAKPMGRILKTKRVVVSLPENKAFLQTVKMPELRGDDLRAAVIFEAENHIPLPLEKVYLDFETTDDQFERRAGAGCEVLIVALPREPIDARLRAITKAGLVPVAMELESQALARAIFAGEKSRVPAIIIQIGDEKTNLIVYSGSAIRFTFSIPISNRYFLETIAKNANLNIKEADVLKRKYGIEDFVDDAMKNEKNMTSSLPERGFDKHKIFEALIPGLVDFTQQIKKYIQYYQTHDANDPVSGVNPNKIIICGSGSDLKGISEFIAIKLNISVEHAKPLIDTKMIESKHDNCFPEQNFCGFSVAAGLAMRGLEEGSKKMENMKIVPPPRPKKPLYERLKKK